MQDTDHHGIGIHGIMPNWAKAFRMQHGQHCDELACIIRTGNMHPLAAFRRPRHEVTQGSKALNTRYAEGLNSESEFRCARLSLDKKQADWIYKISTMSRLQSSSARYLQTIAAQARQAFIQAIA